MKHLIPKTMTAVPVLALALAVGGCGGSSSSDDMMAQPTPEEKCTADGGTWANGMCTTAAMKQVDAIKMKIMMAETAVAAVDDDSTDAEVKAADDAVAAARKAIADASAVSDGEKAGYTTAVNGLASRLTAAKADRKTAMDDAQDTADKAMMATAMKLHMGISTPTSNAATGTASPSATATDRAAAYNDADVPAAGTAVDTRIMVSAGRPASAPVVVALSEDKKTMVAANHGWMGKKYMASGASVDGTYEAVVYSNVEAPTEGRKFGSTAAVTATGDFEYQLEANTALPGFVLTAANADSTTSAFIAARVASSRFDHSAGTKSFKTPDDEDMVEIPGSYHGVSGTYYCTPATNNICAAQVAASGFTLGGTATATGNAFTAGANGGVWVFEPTNPNAMVMSSPDSDYASYGWWIHKSADGMTYTASAFADDKGAVGAASGITALQGTATYMGGAAGKYALYSSTGGTNDAGHFTAKATLEADFVDDMITGTINEFMGADGMSRDWSVELKKSAIGDTGVIGDTTDDGTADASMKTVWTIDETAASAAGQWSGALKNNGTDLVPKVVTGTFNSEYSTAGRMVGAFGANKQ